VGLIERRALRPLVDAAAAQAAAGGRAAAASAAASFREGLVAEMEVSGSCRAAARAPRGRLQLGKGRGCPRGAEDRGV
jgi:hypothetical protein